MALPKFVSEFKFNKMTASELATTKANIVSVYQAGAFFGAIAAYAAGFFLGRKKGLILFAAIFQVVSSFYAWRIHRSTH